ncbi:hypothetical protein W02_09630 [Nitrospira sp. KM1]|uniref:hypothetical protein n=1 Tax=Nitrospira sp. KM1 TaxID=1936990 RepID=UPI0013A7A90B|nr:hypothetical protein [Nitrospira sp. KM1]BCA53823.1 hypothetical protein W02_09630 [Nitrospira sp. KM1]
MKGLRILLAFSLLAPLCGCLPLYVTKQPSITFLVLDPESLPVEQAAIHFLQYDPMNHSTPIQELKVATDPGGRVTIPKDSEWQYLKFTSDSTARNYDWSWCVEKAGFSAEIKNGLRKSGVADREVIRLRPTKNAERCVRSNQHHGIFEVGVPARGK